MAVVDVEADEIQVGKVGQKHAVVTDDDALNVAGPVKVPANALYGPIPQQEEFGSYDFVETAAIEDLAAKLISEKKNLAHLKGRVIRYFWKKKGGTSGGMRTRGKCLKPSGLLYQMADADFIVWLAADNLAGATRHEVEAVLFHELCHAGQDDDGNRVRVPHDVHEFRLVVEQYGLYKPELKSFGKAVRQLSLDEG